MPALKSFSLDYRPGKKQVTTCLFKRNTEGKVVFKLPADIPIATKAVTHALNNHNLITLYNLINTVVAERLPVGRQEIVYIPEHFFKLILSICRKDIMQGVVRTDINVFTDSMAAFVVPFSNTRLYIKDNLVAGYHRVNEFTYNKKLQQEASVLLHTVCMLLSIQDMHHELIPDGIKQGIHNRLPIPVTLLYNADFDRILSYWVSRRDRIVYKPDVMTENMNPLFPLSSFVRVGMRYVEEVQNASIRFKDSFKDCYDVLHSYDPELIPA